MTDNVRTAQRRLVSVARSPLTRHTLRRALAAIVSLDAIVISYVILALALQPFEWEDGALLFVHSLHVCTLLLGSTALYCTNVASGVLVTLEYTAMLAALLDMGAIVGRFIMASHVGEQDESVLACHMHRRRTQLVYAFFALLFLVIDLGYVHTADSLRSHVMPAIANRRAACEAVALSNQRCYANNSMRV